MCMLARVWVLYTGIHPLVCVFKCAGRVERQKEKYGVEYGLWLLDSAIVGSMVLIFRFSHGDSALAGVKKIDQRGNWSNDFLVVIIWYCVSSCGWGEFELDFQICLCKKNFGIFSHCVKEKMLKLKGFPKVETGCFLDSPAFARRGSWNEMHSSLSFYQTFLLGTKSWTS